MTITDTAYSKIDGYLERKKILEGLGIKKTFGSINPFQVTFTRPEALQSAQLEAETLLAAGEQVPDDIGAGVIDAGNVDDLAVARAEILNGIAHRYGDSSVVAADTIDPALNYLRDELARVVTEAKAAGEDLDGASDPGQLLDNPAAASAWKTLRTLAAEYREIRAIQRDLIKQTDDSFQAEKYDAVALFADALDVHPYWMGRRKDRSVSKDNNEQVRDYIAWMKHAHRQTPALEAGLYAEYELYLIATTTAPWLPSLDDYQDAYDAAETASDYPNVSNVDAAEHARARYFATTGAGSVGSVAVTDRGWTPDIYGTSVTQTTSRSAREARARQRIHERNRPAYLEGPGGNEYQAY